jgi:hypothetical protein
MARNSVRTDGGEPGQGDWIDQAGDAAGNAFVVDRGGVISHTFPFETLTVSTAVVPFATIPQGATSAFVTVATTGTRMRIDGVDPTASVGHLFNDASTFTLNTRWELLNARFIRSGSSDSTLSISYGRRLDEEQS